MTMGEDFLPPVKIGVELEVLDGRRSGGLISMSSLHWTVGGDGSLSSYSEGAEYKFTKPLYGNQAIKSVTALCRAMARSNARADSSCGFHLHLDFNNWSYDGLRRFITIAAPFYEKVSGIVHESRVRSGGGYCAARSPSEFASDLSNARDLQSLSQLQRTRYYWMNLASLGRHKSIEIRMHHGTIRSDEVLTWADFWTKLVFYSAKRKGAVPARISSSYINSVIDSLGLHPLTQDRFRRNSRTWVGYQESR